MSFFNPWARPPAPADLNPENARRLDIQRDRALSPAGDVEEAVRAIDKILNVCVGRAKVWPRINELLDARNALRAPRPRSVPVVPGRSS